MNTSNDYDMYDDGFQPDSGVQRKKRGCVFVIIFAFVLIVFVGMGFLLHDRQQAAQPAPTPTLYVDDGKPAEVESGLETVWFSSSGVILDGTVQIVLDLEQGVSNPSALNVLAYPEGAFFDTESRQLVIFGPPALADSHPTSDDFLVALRAVYGQQPLAISIDPISGKDEIQRSTTTTITHQRQLEMPTKRVSEAATLS